MEPFLLTRLAILSLLLLSIAASLSRPRESAAAERVRIGLTTKDFGYLPLFAGIRAGYFADEGLDPQWIVVRSNIAAAGLKEGFHLFAAAADEPRTPDRPRCAPPVQSHCP